MSEPTDAIQWTLDFNPTEYTPEERARMRRIIDQWTIEEEMEDFKRLPFETLSEFLHEREIHLMQLEAFGPDFKREPKISEAWKLLNNGGRAPPAPDQPRQLTLPFEGPKPAP